jgi:cytochrome c
MQMLKMHVLTACIVVFIFLSACREIGKKESAEQAPADLANHPDYQKGYELVWSAATDCRTCHKVDEPLNGPSYREIARYYAGQDDKVVSELARKIIEGSSGQWGAAYMTPHPHLSQQDAEAMVKYILLLHDN